MISCRQLSAIWLAPQNEISFRRRRRLASKCLPTDVAVVGGGAAGLTAAYFAARAGASVVVLEKNAEAGRKILISGGTRCNVLPLQVDPQHDFFTASSSSALRAVLSSWTLEGCLEWLSSPEHIGVPLTLERATSKYFPVSSSAQQVRDHLIDACVREGVSLRYELGLRGLRRSANGGWVCEMEWGEEVLADRVVLATGGKSYPKLGTDGIAYDLASQLGHSLHNPYPALTPLRGGHPGGQELAGLSLHSVELRCTRSPVRANAQVAAMAKQWQQQRQRRTVRAERSDMLFTHRGYSGPAVLDLSHFLIKPMEATEEDAYDLLVNWTGEGREVWEQRLIGRGAGLMGNFLRKYGVPHRLADALCIEAGIPLDRRLSELRKEEREALLTALTCFRLPVEGHEGYAKAEVTGGGVPLNEMDCVTLESRVAQGLHLCGEVLDVFGRIGGFNFYWAWVTGRMAGRAAAKGALSSSQERQQRRMPG